MTPIRRALSFVALAAACSVLLGAALAQAKPNTDYRIYKIYQRYILAARDRAHSAASHRTNSLVLRYGNKNWGLDHLKAKHGWGKSLDNAIQYLVADPKTSVRSEGGGSYRWDDEQLINHELCPFSGDREPQPAQRPPREGHHHRVRSPAVWRGVRVCRRPRMTGGATLRDRSSPG